MRNRIIFFELIFPSFSIQHIIGSDDGFSHETSLFLLTHHLIYTNSRKNIFCKFPFIFLFVSIKALFTSINHRPDARWEKKEEKLKILFLSDFLSTFLFFFDIPPKNHRFLHIKHKKSNLSQFCFPLVTYIALHMKLLSIWKS